MHAEPFPSVKVIPKTPSLCAQHIFQVFVEQPVLGVLEDADRGEHQRGHHERHQCIAKSLQIFERAAGHIIGQENIDEGVKNAMRSVLVKVLALNISTNCRIR